MFKFKCLKRKGRFVKLCNIYQNQNFLVGLWWRSGQFAFTNQVHVWENNSAYRIFESIEYKWRLKIAVSEPWFDSDCSLRVLKLQHCQHPKHLLKQLSIFKLHLMILKDQKVVIDYCTMEEVQTISTLSPPNKFSSANFLVCFNIQSASVSLKVGENDVWVTNSLDPGETASNLPDPSCLHMGLLSCLAV